MNFWKANSELESDFYSPVDAEISEDIFAKRKTIEVRKIVRLY